MDFEKSEREKLRESSSLETYEPEQPELIQDSYEEPNNFEGSNALEKASIFHKIFFTWVFPIWKIAKRNDKLELKMLGTLHKSFQTGNQMKKLQRAWNHYQERSGGAKLCKAIFRAFSCNFAVILLINFIQISIEMISPLILYYVMRFLEDRDNDDYLRGSLLVMALLCSQFVAFFIFEHTFLYADLQGIKAEIVLIGLITQKSLKSTPSASKVFSQGEIVNRLGSDTQNLKYFFHYFCKATKILIALLFGLVGIFKILGLSSLFGLVPLLVVIIINGILANKITGIKGQIMKFQDKRVEMTTQAIQNIKTIKLTAWEAHFRHQIIKAREKELKSFRKFMCFQVINTVMTSSWPAAVIGTMLIAYILLGHLASPSIFYTILLIFQIMRGDLYQLPYIITGFVSAYTSMNRIEGYLVVEEVQPQMIHKRPQDPFQYALQIQNASFAWGSRNSEEPEDE